MILAGFIEVENVFCMRQKKQLRFYRTVSFGHLENMQFNRIKQVPCGVANIRLKSPDYSWVIPLNS